MPESKPKVKVKNSTGKTLEPKVEDGKLKLRNSIEVLYIWQSPERIWKPKSRLWYMSYGTSFALLILVAARLGYYVAIMAILAFMLLWFVQGALQPWVLEHKITSRGIFTNGVLLHWDDMAYFWFAKKEGETLLHIDFLPAKKETRTTLIIDPDEDQLLFNLLVPHVKYGEESDVEYNVIARAIYGKHVPISKYIADLDQE